ncbi:hypothetical protein [Caproiciproducens galactitolivorans]|uniref:Lipoprotein n=1 Tax=Caproiciproducens galactitolivorans TaxID=642589 RepID=A0ABT4BTF2_9FIRM|nr:hypothetical protein [Caproiciproducens galactitolivorans]MCY1714186.1 hypothetical protein [Caproiciproducens galactitolivorans]
MCFPRLFSIKGLGKKCTALFLFLCMLFLSACNSAPNHPKEQSESASSGISAVGRSSNPIYFQSSEDENVEADLKIILSSPKESSNPNDYINAHRKEYENIIKVGDSALYYMLNEFKTGRAEGLRGEVMKAICIEMLGTKNNVPEGSYHTAQEWYAKLEPLNPLPLPKAVYWETDDPDLDFVYASSIEWFASQNEKDTVTIFAPVLYGSDRKGETTKLFATVFMQDFQVLGDTIFETGGAVLPVAITATESGGTMKCTDITQAKDGSYFAPSIREFCGTHKDIAEKMISRYSKEKYQELLKKNLQTYLKDVNISPKYYSNTVEKMTFADYLRK